MDQQGSDIAVAAFADAQQVLLAPLKCCRGTRPSPAATCLPLSKFLASPMVATSALAVIGPMPGIPASLLLASL